MSDQYQNKRVFMTGAAGYIGTAIIELLIPQGYQVCGLSRSEKSDQKLASLGATSVRGDIESLDILRTESAKANIVIHLPDPWRDHITEPYSVTTAIDALAVDAMTEGLLLSSPSSYSSSSPPTPPLLICTSGTAVVQPHPLPNHLTDESSPPSLNPMNGRLDCENHMLSKHCSSSPTSSSNPSALTVAAIRLPPYVYGRGGSGVALFTGMMSSLGEALCFIPPPGGPGEVQEEEYMTSTVHVVDAARMYLAVIARHFSSPPSSPNTTSGPKIYNCTSETSVRTRDLIQAMAELAGVKVTEVGGGRETEEDKTEVEAKFGPLYKTFFTLRNRASSEKARRELGWVPEEGKGILEDIRRGSYVELGRGLREGKMKKESGM